MSQPLVSAILGTHDRAALLNQALGGLCGQSLAADQFEVVLVDDGSTDDTRQTAQAFESRLPLRYVFQARAGLAAAKNHGIAVARAPLLVFLCDQDVIEGDCLESHWRAHQEDPDPEIAVLGYTGLAPTVARSPLMHFVAEVGGHLFRYSTLRHGDRLDFSHFLGGRSSCKRAKLMERGVFNPALRCGCEEIELGYRLSKNGFRVVYDSRARSTMIRIWDYEGFCRRCYLQGQSMWLVANMHPADEVADWAGAGDMASEWRSIAPRYEEVMAAAGNLDRLANELVAAGRELDELTTTFLHRAYHAAFRASRIKGFVDRLEQARLAS